MLLVASGRKNCPVWPYTQDLNARSRNANDRVSTGQHGASSILKISGSPATGLRGRIALAV